MTTTRLFRLEGQTLDLIDLAELFRTGDRKILSQAGQHYLSLQLPADLGDEAALEVAEDELATITGLGLVLVGNHRPVRVAGVSSIDATTGQIRTIIYASGASSVRACGRGIAVVTQASGEIEEPSHSRKSDGEEVLEVTAGNESLQRALYLYGKLEHSWRALYMVLEAIEDGNGGESGLIAKSWGGQPVKNFKATANSYKALGAEARHGTTSKGVDEPKLTLTEANELLQRVLRDWIEELIINRVS